MPVLPELPSGIDQLLASIRRIERRLRTAVLLPIVLHNVSRIVPRIVARWSAQLPVHLPLWWLAWHYCRMLDGKIVRVGRLGGKFRNWLPMVRIMSTTAPTRLELIDADHCMRRDIERTKTDLWALRNDCLDVAQLFDSLGYVSARLQRRQRVLLTLVEQSCGAACVLQEELAAHDLRARALLRSEVPGTASLG